MSEDIRLSMDFVSHRRRKRLQNMLGKGAVICLIDLWLTTGRQRPLGVLEGYSNEDIELDANWDGEEGVFVKALLDIGFLEINDGVLCFHNWKKRQGWVSGTEERGDASRFSRVGSLYPKAFQQLQNAGMKKITKYQYQILKDSLTTKNDSLTNVNEFIRDVNGSYTPAPAPAPAPAPEPAPAPTKIKEPPIQKSEKSISKQFQNQTPGKAPGINLQGNRDVKNSDFSVNLSLVFKEINETCRQITFLPKDSKRKGRFDPRRWAQSGINNFKHPEAIARALNGLKVYWDRSRDPWAYADDILGKVNGNFNELENIAIHEELKTLSANDALSSLTYGLIKRIEP